MKKLIIASNNNGKIKEIKDLLAHLDIEVLSLADANIDIDVEETGVTFKENAYIKAKEIYDLVKIPVLSDDSGLEVAGLNNEPGIYSARYAGPEKDNEKNIDLLIKNVSNLEDRSARFVTAMALIISDEEEHVVESYLEGEIITERRGTNGFGYNPIFYVPEYKRTLGEIEDELRNKITHRSKALRLILKYIEER